MCMYVCIVCIYIYILCYIYIYIEREGHECTYDCNKYIRMNRHAYAYIPTFRHTCTHACTCLYTDGLCVRMIMVRILTNCGTVYTAHTRPLPSEMTQHKVVHTSFSFFYNLDSPMSLAKFCLPCSDLLYVLSWRGVSVFPLLAVLPAYAGLHNTTQPYKQSQDCNSLNVGTCIYI